MEGPQARTIETQQTELQFTQTELVRLLFIKWLYEHGRIRS